MNFTGKKRAAIIIICSILFFCAICAVILAFSNQISEAIVDMIAGETKENDFVSHIYYDYHYSEEQLAQYEDKDRTLYYTYGNETIGITDETKSLFPGEIDFFLRFFEIIYEGDLEAYRALFTDNYYLTHSEQVELFTQLVYDKHVTFISEEYVDGVLTGTYEVSYKLYLNNGYLRLDIQSDASRPQTMVIQKINNQWYIDSIDS